MQVKHEIYFDASDIRSAIDDKLRREHANLCKGKVISVELTGDGNKIVAKVTFSEPSPSVWD